MKLKNLLKLSVVASAMALFSTGCAYRADLTQGNYVEQDLVNELAYGMSGEQVRYVLGTPMLIDPYDNTRWYYVNFTRKGWDDPVIKNLVLLFNGNTLVDMEGDYQKPTTFGAGLQSAPNGGNLDETSSFDLPE